MSPDEQNDAVWPGFAKSTGPFWQLYQEITLYMTRVTRRLDGEEREWFNYLVKGFEEKYRAWERDPTVWSYLDLVEDAGKKGGKVLRVLGHTYLHVAYDLPRVIATSLVKYDITPERAEDIFDWPEREFLDILEKCCRRRDIFGGYAISLSILYVISGKRSLASIRNQGIWLLMLRQHAWRNGLRLANAGSERKVAEEELWRNFDTITQSLTNLYKPQMWVARLTSPWVRASRLGQHLYLHLKKEPQSIEHLKKEDEKEDLRNE